jgi:hypothetical protein
VIWPTATEEILKDLKTKSSAALKGLEGWELVPWGSRVRQPTRPATAPNSAPLALLPWHVRLEQGDQYLCSPMRTVTLASVIHAGDARVLTYVRLDLPIACRSEERPLGKLVINN